MDKCPEYLRIEGEEEKVNRPKLETRYRSNYHPGKVYDLWCTGMMHPPKICAAFGISQDTLGLWLTKHPEFAEQYNLGIVNAQSAWVEHAITHLGDRNFNHKTWEKLIGFAFNGFQEKRKVIISGMKKANTPEKLRKIIATLYEGTNNAEEIGILSKAMADSANSLGQLAHMKMQLDEVKKLVQIKTANQKIGVEGDVYEADVIPIKATDDTT